MAGTVASVSIRSNSLPTASLSPGLPVVATMIPATGEGTSTAALSVMSDASTWSAATVSPRFTFHSTSSTSAMPSPMSGVFTT